MASGPGVSRERVTRDGEGAVDDDGLAEGGGNDVVSSQERGKTSRSVRRRIGPNQAFSPIKETPPPSTIRRGARIAITWVRANANDAGSRQNGGRVGSPAAAASATMTAVIRLGSKPVARERASRFASGRVFAVRARCRAADCPA